MVLVTESTNIDGLNQDEENIKPNTDSSEREKTGSLVLNCHHNSFVFHIPLFVTLTEFRI